MTPEELEKLHEMRRGLLLFRNVLAEIEEKYQQNMDVRRAVAERGRLIQTGLEELCVILEAKSSPDRGE